MTEIESIVYDNFGRLDPDQKEVIVDAMKRYARMKCVEQREIIAEKGIGLENDDIHYFKQDILNAPEPKFE